jgi:hypothetical protein
VGVDCARLWSESFPCSQSIELLESSLLLRRARASGASASAITRARWAQVTSAIHDDRHDGGSSSGVGVSNSSGTGNVTGAGAGMSTTSGGRPSCSTGGVGSSVGGSRDAVIEMPTLGPGSGDSGRVAQGDFHTNPLALAPGSLRAAALQAGSSRIGAEGAAVQAAVGSLGRTAPASRGPGNMAASSINLPGAPTSGSSSSDNNTSSALESGSPFPGSQALGAGTAARVAAALSQRTLRGSLLAGIAAQAVARDGDGPPALGSAPPLAVRSTSPRRPPEAVAGAIDSLSPQVVSPPASPRDVREW